MILLSYLADMDNLELYPSLDVMVVDFIAYILEFLIFGACEILCGFYKCVFWLTEGIDNEFYRTILFIYV